MTNIMLSGYTYIYILWDLYMHIYHTYIYTFYIYILYIFVYISIYVFRSVHILQCADDLAKFPNDI